MSTRGCWGFYKKGTSSSKITYNHMDSYPEFLGQSIVDFVKQTSIEELHCIFDKIILVDESAKPTDIQVNECKMYADTGVSTGSLYDWYCLLRDTQGKPELYKKELRYMLDSGTFIRDSLFCEWGYVINLTDNILEIYQGYRKRPNKRSNRYRLAISSDGYYACEIIASFPLSEIPDNWLEIIHAHAK